MKSVVKLLINKYVILNMILIMRVDKDNKDIDGTERLIYKLNKWN